MCRDKLQAAVGCAATLAADHSLATALQSVRGYEATDSVWRAACVALRDHSGGEWQRAVSAVPGGVLTFGVLWQLAAHACGESSRGPGYNSYQRVILPLRIALDLSVWAAGSALYAGSFPTRLAKPLPVPSRS